MPKQRKPKSPLALSAVLGLVVMLPSLVVAADNRSDSESDSSYEDYRRVLNRGYGGISYGAYDLAYARAMIQARIAHARAVLGQALQNAERARGELGAAEGKIQSALSEIQAAKSGVKLTGDQLKAVQAQVENSQDPDSEYVRAKLALEEVRANYEEVRRKVFNSPDYKEKYREALAAFDRAKRIVALRNKTFANNRELRAARADLELAKKMYGQARYRILESSDEYKQAGAEARQALREKLRGEQGYFSGMFSRTGANHRLNHYSNIAVAAQRAISIGEAQLEAIDNLQQNLDYRRQWERDRYRYRRNRDRSGK